MSLSERSSVPSKSYAYVYCRSHFGAWNKVPHCVPEAMYLRASNVWLLVPSVGAASGIAISCKEDAAHNDNRKWKDCWFPRSKYLPKYNTMLFRVWSRASRKSLLVNAVSHVSGWGGPAHTQDWSVLVGHLSAIYIEHWSCLLQSAVQSIRISYDTAWNQSEACKFGRLLQWRIWTRTCAWNGRALVPHICGLMFKFKPELEPNSLHQTWNLRDEIPPS